MTGKTSEFGIGEAGTVSASTPRDEAEAERIQPTAPRAMETVVCPHCGERVSARLMMWTSYHGRVCADCYDDVEDEG